MVEVNEVLDAQTVDVRIVSDSLQGKVLAEVGTVDANRCGELGKRNVVLQIELLCETADSNMRSKPALPRMHRTSEKEYLPKPDRT